jgi:membrane-bound ClpP family serine protease
MTERDNKPRHHWRARIAIKYAFLQIPGTILVVLVAVLINRKMGIPPWLFWGLIIGSVLKDILLFPFVWRSYDSKAAHPMIGARGEAIEPLSPEGYIRIHGELWQARLADGYSRIARGEFVRVREAHGIKLIVEPEG